MDDILFRLRLVDIVEAQIESLMTLQVEESVTLDYKLELKLDSEKDRREFCKDVSAMAHTRGGHILFGISEDDGVPVEIPGIVFGDSDRQRVHQVLSSGISPRLQNIEEYAVDLDNGNRVLILRISPDGRLHQVKYSDNRSYKRVGTITVVMDPADTEAFFQAAAGNDRDSEVVRQATAYFDSLRAREYFLGVGGNGIFAVHMSPETGSLRIDLANLRREFSEMFGPMYCGGWRSQVKGRSRLTYGEVGDGSPPYAVTEVTQGGVLQAYSTGILDNASLEGPLPDGVVGYVPSTALGREMIRVVNRYSFALENAGVSFPIFVQFALLDICGYYLAVDNYKVLERGRVIRDGDIVLDPIYIVDRKACATMDAAARLLQPTLDFIWREFGFERCFDYTPDGRWIGG